VLAAIRARRVRYREDGWQFRRWRDHRTHYIAHGPPDGPPVVLVHGFGASSYHWRHNFAALADAGYRVYAPCLLGYGFSDKALVDYSLEFWGAQVSDFVRDVVKRPAVLAGNSIGAVTVLSAAYIDPSLVRGVVLLNAAGRFEADEGDAKPADPDAPPSPLSVLFRRIVSAAIFYSTKLRIGPILRSVYFDGSRVDEELVRSIAAPTRDPNALEAFFLISGSGGRSRQSLNALLLAGLQAPGGPIPLLQLHGAADPWMKPSKAERIKELYPPSTLVLLPNASHCPHDDAPRDVNDALLSWLATLPAPATA
jgi:pimeloyl-ACP methyl ester carboxylesterase